MKDLPTRETSLSYIFKNLLHSKIAVPITITHNTRLGKGPDCKLRKISRERLEDPLFWVIYVRQHARLKEALTPSI